MSLLPVRWRTESPKHCCHPSHSDIEVECGTLLTESDGGGGPYAVLSVREVSFDTAKDFDRWAYEVRLAIGQIETRARAEKRRKAREEKA